MKITKNPASLMGFLLTLAALAPSTVEAVQQPTMPSVEPTTPNIEGRLSRLSAVLRSQMEQLPTEKQPDSDPLVARGFADGRGRGWVDGRRGGWVDGRGGSFRNRNGWHNGWPDRGGFANFRNY
ncbi:MAG: GrrA/OscA1 family cyclophane-containing rSAM-modified RiPP [Cyanobacteria bacterium P01_H01_bin.15]